MFYELPIFIVTIFSWDSQVAPYGFSLQSVAFSPSNCAYIVSLAIRKQQHQQYQYTLSECSKTLWWTNAYSKHTSECRRQRGEAGEIKWWITKRNLLSTLLAIKIYWNFIHITLCKGVCCCAVRRHSLAALQLQFRYYCNYYNNPKEDFTPLHPIVNV